MGTRLGPKYVPYTYMDPLGVIYRVILDYNLFVRQPGILPASCKPHPSNIDMFIYLLGGFGVLGV